MDSTEKFEEKTKKILKGFKNDLKGMRSNRPNTSLVEDIKVDYHGEKTPIKHVASVSISPPREIVIDVWEKDMVPKVSKAIEKSDVNLSPSVDDENVVRIFLPELSEERRKELLNFIKKKAENYRIQIRKVREEANDKIDNLFEEGDISEDNKFRLRESIQELTEKANKEIEDLIKKKEKHINN